jgi:uncharacterized SAM-binding protein YcdF (DUF218 family)
MPDKGKFWRNVQKMFPVFLAASLSVLCALLAPGFLCLQEEPRPADAVVLFVGPENQSRLEEAEQLIRDKKARYLLVPSSGMVYAAGPDGGVVKMADQEPRSRLIQRIRIAARYRTYYENTHIEALEAKRMLEDLHLNSAVLVSSNYHMRRIHLIANRVFDRERFSIACHPARWQGSFAAADWLDRGHRTIIVNEYLKIVWFLAYGVLG